MFVLDLFNNDHERRLAEGAVDQLEQRRIDDLAMKMDDLVARAKEPAYKKNPAALAALMKEFQKCKAERDSYYTIRNETMGYGSLGEGQMKQEMHKAAERMTLSQFIDRYGDEDWIREFWNNINGPIDEAGIPGNVPTEKIPGKEDLLKGKGRSYYEGAEDYAGIYSPDAIALGKRFCEHYNITDDGDIQLAVEIIDSYLDEFKATNSPVDLKKIKSGVADAFRQVYRGMGPGPTFRKKFQEIQKKNSEAVAEQSNLEQDDWYDDKEDQETELRSGDYVRDRQDGESGEVFRMQGDPEERRVRILDRDGKGWYIEPSRLTRVDPQDPDVQRYFGKQRQRDMDEGINEGLIYSGDTWQDVLYRINVLNDIFGDQKDLAASFEPASQPEWIPFRDRILRSRTVLDTYAKVKQLANMNVPLTDVEIEMLADVAWDGGGGPVEPAGHWEERDYEWLEDLYAQQFAVVQHLLDQRAQSRIQNKTKSGQTVHEQGALDQVKRVFKDKADRPVGEIGIDPESSPGNGEWYVHHYATGYSVVGFDSAAEAKRELLYVHKHPDAVEGHPSTTEQGVAEAIVASGPSQSLDDRAVRKLVWDTMKINADSGEQAIQRALSVLAKKPQSRMVQDLQDKFQSLADRLTQGVTETALNPKDPQGDYAAKRKALQDLGMNKAVDQAAVLQRRLDLDREAKAKGLGEGWSDAVVARRTGQPRTPYSVYIKGKKWKDFENDDHAEAVANKLRAKFKADGRDPSVITIAPTDIPEGVAEGETDYSKRRARERDVDAGKPVPKQRPSKMTDYQKRRAQQKKEMELGEESSTSSEAVERAILNRIMTAHTDLLMKYGPDKVMQAAEEVAYNVGDVDEIGTSDVSAYVAQVKQILGAVSESQLDEKWSAKYKSSINCSNPKGFSQKAHCAGKKK